MLGNFLSRLKTLFVGPISVDPPDSFLSSNSKSYFMPSSHFPLTIEFYMRGYIVVGVRARDGPERYQLAKHMVTQLEHRKIVARGEKPEHEDIVATIVDNEGHPFRILIERRKHSPKVSTSKYEDDQAERTITTWSLLKFASPTVFNNPLSDIASQEIATLQSKGTTLIDGANNASEPKSPQDSIDTSFPALDVIRTLMPDNHYHTHVVILRTFEPSPNTLSLLSLAVAIEATHDAQPDYRIFPGQSRWFALTVMGVSMLQGGRVKVFEGKGDPGPHWEPLSSHISSDTHLPVVLGLPVPKPEPFENNSQTQGSDSSPPSSDLLAQTPDSAKAGWNQLPIVKPSFQEILAIAQESQQRYDALYKALVAPRAPLLTAEEAEARAEAAVASLAAQRAEVEVVKKALEESKQKGEAALRQVEEYAKQLESLRSVN